MSALQPSLRPLLAIGLLGAGTSVFGISAAPVLAQLPAPAADGQEHTPDDDAGQRPDEEQPASTVEATQPTPTETPTEAPGETHPEADPPGHAADLADASTPADPASAPRDAQAKQQARHLYEQALQQYDAGHYTSALSLLQQASQLYDSHRFIFNVAQTRRRLGQCAAAREDYLRYLAQETDPERRALAEVGLDRLRTCKPTDDSAVASAPLEPPGDPVWIGWTTAAVLGAAWITTGSIALAIDGKIGKAEKRLITPQMKADLESDGRTTALVADLLGVATLTALGASLVWTLVDSRGDDEEPQSAAPDTPPTVSATVGPGEIIVRGRF